MAQSGQGRVHCKSPLPGVKADMDRLRESAEWGLDEVTSRSLWANSGHLCLLDPNIILGRPVAALITRIEYAARLNQQ